jgi:hypothetical protein
LTNVAAGSFLGHGKGKARDLARCVNVTASIFVSAICWVECLSIIDLRKRRETSLLLSISQAWLKKDIPQSEFGVGPVTVSAT